jgi:hypothetical protein
VAASLSGIGGGESGQEGNGKLHHDESSKILALKTEGVLTVNSKGPGEKR